MAALAADRNTVIGSNPGRVRRCGLAAVKCYKGGIACKNAAGFLTPATDTAGLTVVGIFEETVDNSGGAAGDLSASYLTGIDADFLNAGSAVVQATEKAYVADDQSVTTAAVAVHDVLVGTVVAFTAAKVTIFIDEQSSVAGA